VEDIGLLEKYKRFGNKWSKIAKKIPERTESAIKNRIKSLLNKEAQTIGGAEGSLVEHLIMKFRMEVSGDLVYEDDLSASPCSIKRSEPTELKSELKLEGVVSLSPVNKADFGDFADTVVKFKISDLDEDIADQTPNFPSAPATMKSFTDVVSNMSK
jgi:hypothetical protein